MARPRKCKRVPQEDDGRRRVWCFEVYPDSAPADWLAQLQDAHIKAFVSPLHDADHHESGEPKKAHYHVQVMFDGKKSLAQVRQYFGGYASNGYIEPCKSLEGYARYLCHLDNPEKAQYQVSDVRELGGADYLATIGQPGDLRRYVGEMQDWARANRCVYFSQLLDYAKTERPDWHQVLCTRCAMVVSTYLRALEYEFEQEAKRTLQRTPAIPAEIRKADVDAPDERDYII